MTLNKLPENLESIIPGELKTIRAFYFYFKKVRPESVKVQKNEL